jgi:hypothetical protein
MNNINPNTLKILTISCVWIFVGFYFFEWWAARNLKLKIFSIGPRLVNFQESWQKAIFPSPTIFETHSGIFKVIDQNLLLFKYKEPILSFQFKTPLPLKGTIRINDNVATIEGRTPIVPLIVIFGLFAFINYVGLKMLLSDLDAGNKGLKVLFFGWGVVLLMIVVSYLIERKRLLKVFYEIKNF